MHKIKRNEIIMSLAITANFIVDAISMILPMDNMFAYYMVALGIASTIVSSIVIDKKIFLLSIILSLQIGCAFFFVNSDTTLKFALCFVAIGIPAMMLSVKTIKIYNVFSLIQWIGLFGFPRYIHLLQMEYTVYNAGEQMGISYEILPLFISAIIILFNKKKFSNKVLWITIYNSIMGILVFARLMTRGAILCIIVAIWLSICFKIQFNKKFLLRFIIASVAIVLVYFLFLRSTIINSRWFYYIFELKKNNVLNGREADFQNLYQNVGLFEVLFGHGIGSYLKIYGRGYDYFHNLFGQLFFEQGLITLLIVLIIIFKGIHMMFSDCDEPTRWMLLLLFCTSVVRLMVSYYFWTDQLFWVFIAYVINVVRRYKREEYEKRTCNNNNSDISTATVCRAGHR